MKTKVSIVLVLATMVLFAFNACSPKVGSSISTTERIFYPPPPNQARIQYLTSISSSSDIVKKQSSLQKTVVGELKGQPIYKPYGVLINDHKIYVCDVSIGGLEVIDLDKKEFSYFVPKGAYQLKMPLNCFADEQNKLYVVDADLHRIMIYNELGKYETAMGMDENINPTAISIFENEVFVVDSENHRVNIYDKDTNLFKSYFPKVSFGEEGYLYKPTNLTIANNRIFISDMGEGCIKVYELNGKYLKKIGRYGRNLGEFVRPKGVAVDREENIYVVDASFENIQLFNKDGQLLMFFGGHYSGHGGMWLPTSVVIDYEHLEYFEKYVDPKYKLEYIIIVANQFGPDKLSIYGRVVPAN